MNYKGAKSVGNLQLAMVLIMCAAVVVSVIGVIATGHFDASNLQPAYGAEGKSLGSGFVSILALAPFLYVGFDCIPQAAEEYDFPPQKCKMLIISALIVGALIYGAMALVTDCVVPWQQVLTMTDANGTLVKWHTGAVLDLAMGKVGVCFVALAVCMGIFTGMNGFFMTSSRLLFGMARAKMLPSAFEKVHPEHKNSVHMCWVYHDHLLYLPIFRQRSDRLGCRYVFRRYCVRIFLYLCRCLYSSEKIWR